MDTPELVYDLIQQYKTQAAQFKPHVCTPKQQQQYHTLTSTIFRGLKYLLKCNISPLQEISLCIETSQLLINETHNVDLAEEYLNRAKTIAQRNNFTTKRFTAEYMLCCAQLERSHNLGVRMVLAKIEELKKLQFTRWTFLFRMLLYRYTNNYTELAQLYNECQWSIVKLCELCVRLSVLKVDSFEHELQLLEHDKLTSVMQLLYHVVMDRNISQLLDQCESAPEARLSFPVQVESICGEETIVVDVEWLGTQHLQETIHLLTGVSYLVNSWDGKQTSDTAFSKVTSPIFAPTVEFYKELQTGVTGEYHGSNEYITGLKLQSEGRFDEAMQAFENVKDWELKSLAMVNYIVVAKSQLAFFLDTKPENYLQRVQQLNTKLDAVAKPNLPGDLFQATLCLLDMVFTKDYSQLEEMRKKSYKKAILLHFLIDFLIVEAQLPNDNLAERCFHLSRNGHYPMMRYVSGLLNLNECYKKMHSKSYAVQKEKLKKVMAKLVYPERG